MTFGQHLEELRRRLFRALLASLAGLLLVFARHEQVLEVVTLPFREAMIDLGRSPALNTFSVQGAFFVSVKVSFVVGLILTAPIWIYQLWAFVAAGLYAKERRVVYRFVPPCIALFVAGVLFGYHVLVPIGLQYLLGFANPAVIQNTVGVNEYLGLFALLTLVLGLAFQLPIVLIGIVRAGLITVEALRARRKWTILIIFVIAAVVTPPDPITQSLLAVPLCALFEIGLFVAALGAKAAKPKFEPALIWRRARVPLALVILLAAFHEPILGIWREQQFDGRLMVFENENGLERKMFERPLGEPPEFALTLGQDGVSRLVVIVGAARMEIARVERKTDEVLPLDSDLGGPEGRVYRYRLIPAGEQIALVSMPEEFDPAPIAAALLELAEGGTERVVQAARRVLARIFEPALGQPLPQETKDVRKAIERFLADHPKHRIKPNDGRLEIAEGQNK